MRVTHYHHHFGSGSVFLWIRIWIWIQLQVNLEMCIYLHLLKMQLFINAFYDLGMYVVEPLTGYRYLLEVLD